MYVCAGSVWQLDFGTRLVSCSVVRSEPKASAAVRVTARTKIDFIENEQFEADADAHTPSRHTSLQTVSVGGLQEQRERLLKLIALPLQRRDALNALGVAAPRGVLLYGPPGTGKTLLAQSIAAETRAHWCPLSAPELVRSQLGESEAVLRAAISDALQHAPAIVFIDEVDVIAPQRDDHCTELERRLVGALVASFERLQDAAVVIVAATNRVDAIDDALRRPGRFDAEIEIGVPSESQRCGVCRVRLLQYLTLAHTRQSRHSSCAVARCESLAE